MRTRNFTIGLLAAGALAMAPMAGAQPAEAAYGACDRTPTESDVAAAKGAFSAGRVSFDEADYPRAIGYWEDAFRRDCNATGLLLNLSRAYELDGQPEAAIVALDTYLERHPDTPQRAQLEKRIEVLRDKESPARVAEPVTLPPAEEVRDPASPDAPAVDSVGAATAPEPATRPLLPLIVAGAGATVFVVSGLVYLAASADVSKYERECTLGSRGSRCPDTDTAEAANDAVRYRDFSGALALGGVAVGIVGVTWYFLTPPSPSTAATSQRGLALGDSLALDAGMSPTFSGLRLTGAF